MQLVEAFMLQAREYMRKSIVELEAKNKRIKELEDIVNGLEANTEVGLWESKGMNT